MPIRSLTTRAVTVNTTSQILQPQNTNRSHLSVLNNGTNSIFVHFGSTAEDVATTDTGIEVRAGELYEPFQPGRGYIHAISSSGNNPCIVTESIVPEAPIEQPFSPTDITGLYLWYDANDPGSSFANGDPVTTWNDLSGGDRHLSQVFGVNVTPTFSDTSINGMPAVVFNDTPGRKSLNASVSITGTNQVSVFGVVKRTATANFQSFFSLIEGQTDEAAGAASLANALGSTTQVSTFRNGTTLAVSPTHPDTGTPFVFSNIFDGTDNNIYINGTVGTESTHANATTEFNADVFRVGARARGSLEYADVPCFYDIGEIIVYVGTTLTQTERENVEEYLSNKWSI